MTLISLRGHFRYFSEEISVAYFSITSFTFWWAEPSGIGRRCWLTNHCPSVLWHCWLGHLTRWIISKMTYNVSSGMLNPFHCQWPWLTFEGHFRCYKVFHCLYLKFTAWCTKLVTYVSNYFYYRIEPEKLLYDVECSLLAKFAVDLFLQVVHSLIQKMKC